MKIFLYCLNLIYKISLYIMFARPLLDQIHYKIKYDIQIIFNNFHYLNLIADKFFNINYKGMINIFCYTKLGVLYLSFQDISIYIYNT